VSPGRSDGASRHRPPLTLVVEVTDRGRARALARLMQDCGAEHAAWFGPATAGTDDDDPIAEELIVLPAARGGPRGALA
jgi:hypothetical protein